jgi:hypothetical protein
MGWNLYANFQMIRHLVEVKLPLLINVIWKRIDFPLILENSSATSTHLGF